MVDNIVKSIFLSYRLIDKSYSYAKQRGLYSPAFSLAPVAGLLHIGLTFHLSCADTADHNVDMDVSRMVVPIRVSADNGRMTGEVFFAEFQAKCLCLFHGQAVVGCISGVKADDILVALDIIMLVVLAVLAVCQQTGRCRRKIATLKRIQNVRFP